MEGKSYSTINIARSALSAIGLKQDGVTVGSHPTIVRLMKGMFNLRPTRARTSNTWDVNKVIDHLRNLPTVKDISTKELTMKLTMLLALTHAARPQTLHLITIEGMRKSEDNYTLNLSAALKQTKPGKPLENIIVRRYPHDNNLCAYTTLQEYLSRTAQWREHNGPLLLSYVKPHKPVSRDTIKRWMRTVMKNSGIDTNQFTAYSTRAAAVSKAAETSIPMECILKTAGWSRESTFAKFYHKNIVTETSFSETILNV